MKTSTSYVHPIHNPLQKFVLQHFVEELNMSIHHVHLLCNRWQDLRCNDLINYIGVHNMFTISHCVQSCSCWNVLFKCWIRVYGIFIPCIIPCWSLLQHFIEEQNMSVQHIHLICNPVQEFLLQHFVEEQNTTTQNVHLICNCVQVFQLQHFVEECSMSIQHVLKRWIGLHNTFTS